MVAEIGYALKTGQLLLQKSRMGSFFAHPTIDRLSRIEIVVESLYQPFT